jgi:hypothetical protein
LVYGTAAASLVSESEYPHGSGAGKLMRGEVSV